jgi:Co/Zn/Cd efflux system component
MIDDKMISEGALIIQQVEGVMKEKFHISHTTIQLECDNCECGMVCSMVSKNERK